MLKHTQIKVQTHKLIRTFKLFMEGPLCARNSERYWDLATNEAHMVPALVGNIVGIVLQFIFSKSYFRSKRKPHDLNSGGKMIRESESFHYFLVSYLKSSVQGKLSKIYYTVLCLK